MTNDPKTIRTWVQVIISAILLIVSILIIVFESSDSVKLKWAFGIVGIIIGYWLK
jgi:hypothetical protein